MKRTCVLILVLAVMIAPGVFGSEGDSMDMEGVFNVKSHGAKADGTTDDTAAIQAAMDEAGKLGGKVYLPPGKYMVRGTFKVPQGVHVEGAANAPVYSLSLIHI